jgi:large subunit ribosomal protein L17
MRHRKNTIKKLGRVSAHRRCLMANMLKDLIHHERIETTLVKAKVLRSYADQMITLAKENTLASRRRAIAELMIRYNQLTPKDAREAKKGDLSSYNVDRIVIKKLFDVLGVRFANRQGGYTRLIPGLNRVGDNSKTCVIEYLSE